MRLLTPEEVLSEQSDRFLLGQRMDLHPPRGVVAIERHDAGATLYFENGTATRYQTYWYGPGEADWPGKRSR